VQKIALCLFVVLLGIPRSEAAEAHHPLWSMKGARNTVYLLGSIHFLKPSEQLPDVVDRAYRESEALVMEIDMDDIEPFDMQQATLELGMLPEGQSLEQQLDAATYAKIVAQAREVGFEVTLLNRFRPWLAAMTLVQLQLMKMGLDPESGVEQRFVVRAAGDRKPIQGLETLRQQLAMLANLPARQQREFLLYSVEDSEHVSEEIDTLLSAWRQGDTKALAQVLSEGFKRYPDLYRPLTTDRNRQWIASIENLLDDKEDYLVVVGTLHLVGKDSVIELLERRGHKVTQH
jgi:uncharacterized protein